MFNIRWAIAALQPRITRLLWGKRRYRQRVFMRIYAQHSWGKDDGVRFHSGAGSRGSVSQTYVEKMGAILADFALTLDHPMTIVDLGCGDFQIGRALLRRLPDAYYVGCDIVPELIEHHQQAYGSERIKFLQLDLVCDPLPAGDVCLVRQVLQHLSNNDIATFLDRASFDRLYITEGQPQVREGAVNPDKLPGAHVRFDWGTGRGRGVELDKAPFKRRTKEQFRTSLGSHEIIITEQVYVDQEACHDGRRS